MNRPGGYRGVRRTPATVIQSPTPSFARPATSLLTSLLTQVTKLDLPAGHFNPGFVSIPPHVRLPDVLAAAKYVVVARADESAVCGMLLDGDLRVMPETKRMLRISQVTDPRLVWIGGTLIMTFSQHGGGSFKGEHIRAAAILTADNPGEFLTPQSWRVSPPIESRQKNWLPFATPQGLCFIANFRPFQIFVMRGPGCVAELLCETDWVSPWFSDGDFRGSANPVRLDSGEWLASFHTVQRSGPMHFYDNGCCTFSNEFPFRMLRCATRTFVPAEAAVAPHFRKAGAIKVAFVTSAVREGDQLRVAFGDNDSECKIASVSVNEMLASTVQVS